jgi:hypothetical protein
MNYTESNGKYYKVISDNQIITFGELESGQILSTIKEVVFISESEYNELSKAKEIQSKE